MEHGLGGVVLKVQDIDPILQLKVNLLDVAVMLTIVQCECQIIVEVVRNILIGRVRREIV